MLARSVADPEASAVATAPSGLRLDPADIAVVVERALREDVGSGDVTTNLTVDADRHARAQLLLKEAGVVAGLDVAIAVFTTLAPGIGVARQARDGELRSDVPVVLANIEGPARAILTGERTALNLLSHLSGIATLTRRYVDAVSGTGAVILDTRKTTAGLRSLEKYAVRAGGGTNHRAGLYDAILIKDNHLQAAGGVRPAVERARAAVPPQPIEVEADTLDQVREALAAGADRILLDNMPLGWLREAVEIVGGRCPLEASGGVTLATVRAIAETGVDFISVGALTHSAPSLDVSLEVL